MSNTVSICLILVLRVKSLYVPRVLRYSLRSKTLFIKRIKNRMFDKIDNSYGTDAWKPPDATNQPKRKGINSLCPDKMRHFSSLLDLFLTKNIDVREVWSETREHLANLFMFLPSLLSITQLGQTFYDVSNQALESKLSLIKTNLGPKLNLSKHVCNRYHSRFFYCLAHPNLSATLATDQKWPLSCLRISYQNLAECHLL